VLFFADFIGPSRRENFPNLMSKAYVEAKRACNAKLAAPKLDTDPNTE